MGNGKSGWMVQFQTIACKMTKSGHHRQVEKTFFGRSLFIHL